MFRILQKTPWTCPNHYGNSTSSTSKPRMQSSWSVSNPPLKCSIGDGASLTSLLLASTRKTLELEALPSFPIKKRAGHSTYSSKLWWLFSIWTILRLIWNTFVDFMLFVATFFFLKDTKSLIKGAPRCNLTTKRFVYRKNVMNTVCWLILCYCLGPIPLSILKNIEYVPYVSQVLIL